MKKYFRKGLKIILWIIASLLGVILLLIIALQIPPIQRYTKDKVVSYLQNKINTTVTIEKVQIGFPKDVILEGVYFEDQKNDTLLAAKKIAVNLNLFELMNNKVQINSVDLDGVIVNINRNTQSQFNFDYIIEAFKSPEKQDDTSPPMEFSMDKIMLENIKFRYTDAVSKNDVKLKLNHLDTRIKIFDLNQMNFEIPNFKIDGMQLVYKQEIAGNIPISTAEQSKSPDLKLKLGIIDLSKIKVDYQDENSKVYTDITLNKILVKVNNLDLKNNIIDLDNLELADADGRLQLGKITNLGVGKAKASPSNWKVNLNQVAFKKVNFSFDDDNGIAVQKGIDYRHLNVQNFNLNAEKIAYTSQQISGKINAMEVEEKSGLKVESFKTTFFYSQQSAYVKDLYLKTPQTLLRNEIVVGYPSIETLSKNLDALTIKANLNQSRIGFKDVLIFAPELSQTVPFKDNPNAIVSLNTTISGTLSNLSIPNFQISGIGTTQLDASGSIVGLPDTKKAYFNLNVKNLQTTASDVYSFIPTNTIPNTIQLPAEFSAKGTFKGTIQNFNTNLSLATSSGNGTIQGSLDQRTKDKEKYSFDTAFDDFDLGRLIKNDSIGKISLNANITGTGFNMKTANAIVKARVAKANFNRYTYQNLVVDGSTNNGFFKAMAFIKDPNLKFDMVSSGSFNDKYPSGKIHLNVDIADLNKLNLHAGPLKMRGVLDADIQSANLDYLNGKASINNLIIANDKDQFVTDSINLVAISTSEKNSIILRSQFMDADFEGKYKLSTLANSVKNSISSYYNLKTSSKNVLYNQQQVTFKANVKSTPVLLKLIPELKNLEPISLNGRYNSVNDSIVLNGSIPKLVYGPNTIANGTIKVETKDNSLVYSLNVDQIKNATLEIPKTSISGQVANNVIDYTVLVKDVKNTDRYQIAGTLKSVTDGTEISLDSENLLLNYESWTLTNDNRIRLTNNGIYVTNFDLSKDGNRLTLQSLSQGTNPPLTVDFKNFEIKTITDIVQMKNIEMDGMMNGTVELKNVTSKALFTAALTIDDFSFKKEVLGKITINVDNYTANTYTAKVEISGQDNQVNLDGTYKATDSNLTMDLDIQKLNVKSIQGFSMDNITDGTGYLTGKFKISGNTSNPKLIGALKFNEVGFKATKLNATFKSINDTMVFTDTAILLDNFTIKDEKNNDLIINGKLNNQDYANLGFDVVVDANNFNAVNSKAKDNDTFYGELYLDNHLIVKGNMNNPVVEGTIKINKDTKFTVVLPQDDPSIADREGIVEFIDQDQPRLIALTTDQTITETQVKGIDASVTIEIDKEAELSMIIDKANGDFLRLKGEGQLTGGIDPSGKTTLTGRYELAEGSYEMNFNLIKRKFDIKKGSYILWTGSPTMADINITAIYKTETAPIDLLDNQLTGLTPEERNTYKQKIPFETELKMKGELLKPTISFDIILPEGNSSVSSDIIAKTEAKLAQLRQEPDELNKQVFALLLLNRFVGENPFSSESGGTTASGLARESASKILSQQLNNLASDLVKGFDLNFDLASSEDYTTGQKENRTDLNVGLSKRLLNDRLKVTVGSTFGIEGPEQKNRETNTIAGDISAEYELSKDGRYKLRAYRKNLYQVALQGQVIETGVGFIITLDYDTFKELFQSKKEPIKPKEKAKLND